MNLNDIYKKGTIVTIKDNFKKYDGCIAGKTAIIDHVRDTSTFSHCNTCDFYVDVPGLKSKFRADGLFIIPQRFIKEITDSYEPKKYNEDQKYMLGYLQGFKDGCAMVLDHVKLQ